MVSHASDTENKQTKTLMKEEMINTSVNKMIVQNAKALTWDKPMTNNSIGIPISTQFPNWNKYWNYILA